jgi:phenylpropionate dioxygenase-like ring-hydroxylating dioxygenase large terminal subunit
MEQPQSASQELVAGNWPRYTAATRGFRNYWYPVLVARELGTRPLSVTLLGERIVLVRQSGRAYALHDRCPHRGVPLAAGRCRFPGTITCAYHGWTYELATGRLMAVLTDGPDSPIRGKANVPTYPVEERVGLVWVYVGDEPPPPVEADIPDDLLQADAVVEGLIEVRPGNWRYAVENGIDEGHAKYLHQETPWSWFTEFSAWTRGVRVFPSEDGQWLVRVREESVFEDTYEGIGRWPPKHFWQRKGGAASSSLRVRLPGTVRVGQSGGWLDYEIFVPVDDDHHRAVLLSVKHARGLSALLFRVRYWLYIRWLYRGLLGNQDQWMIELMQTPPERLYRPDVAISGWRRWCQDHARGQTEETPAATAASAAHR